MDDYKTQLQLKCSVGGIHCACCNPYFGKDKKMLNRMARTMLKRNLQKDLKTVDNN